MEVTLTIAAVGLLAGGIAALVTRDRRRADPLEPAIGEKAADVVADDPDAAAAVAQAPRPVVGGVALSTAMLVIFGLALVAGLMFDMVDEQFGFARWDEAVAEWGASNASDTSTRVLDWITTLGGTRFITLVTVIVAGWGWWRWKNPNVALFLATVAIGQAVVNNGLKWIVMRDRPDISQLAEWSGSSFPSGHSAAAAATFAGVALVLSIGRSRATRAWLAGAAALLAMMIAATRALLGVHWLTDVIAGVAVGWGWFTVCAIVFGGRIMRFGAVRDDVAAKAGGTERGGR